MLCFAISRRWPPGHGVGRRSPAVSLDGWLPEYDEVSQHSITVAAAPQAVWDALKSADFARSWMLRALLTARGIGRQHLDLSSFIDREFVVLEESEPSTIVLGMVGRPHRSANRPSIR